MSWPYYWNSSKFADWIRGVCKPQHETMQGWDDWKKESAAQFPFRYWFVEVLIPKIQRVATWPLRKSRDLQYHIINRFSTHTHALISTSLRKGQWNELDERLLFCPFDELVNFVEISEAGERIGWSDTDRKQYLEETTYEGPWGFRIRRCPAAGVDQLKWAASLVFDTDTLRPDNPDIGRPTSQALAAQETLILYHWWKNIRPARLNPHDLSGLTDFYATSRASRIRGKEGKILTLPNNPTPAETLQKRKMYELLEKIIAEYEAEDTEMLIRLMKHRRNFWN